MLSEVLLAYPLINRARVPRWVFFNKSIYSGIARVRESIIPIARFRPFGCSPSATSQIEPIFVMTSCSMRTCHSFLLMHPTGLHHDIRRLKHLSRTHCCCLTACQSLSAFAPSTDATGTTRPRQASQRLHETKPRPDAQSYSNSITNMAWSQLEPTGPHLTYVFLTSFLIMYALFSLMIRNRLHLSEPPLATLFGIVSGLYLRGLRNLDADSTINLDYWSARTPDS
jgi:hypothetical protein